MNNMNTKEKIEIMQAYLDGKTVQFTRTDDTDTDAIGIWHDVTSGDPIWNFEANTYRVKPKQKVKKTVKYLCFEQPNGFLSFAKEGSNACFRFGGDVNFVRVPELDKTRAVEVDE